jgi:hypothetical protein
MRLFYFISGVVEFAIEASNSHTAEFIHNDALLKQDATITRYRWVIGWNLSSCEQYSFLLCSRLHAVAKTE